MGRIRDLVSLWVVFAVGFSIFSNQVMLSEISSDIRRVLTFSDHLSLSVDHFYQITLRLATYLLFSLAAAVVFGFLQGTFSAGRVYSQRIRRVVARKWRRPVSEYAPPAFGQTNSAFLAAEPQTRIDLHGKAREVSFAIEPAGFLLNIAFAAAACIIFVLVYHELIWVLNGVAISDVWTSPSAYVQSIMDRAIIIFIFLRAFLGRFWARVETYVDGERVEDASHMERIFGSQSAKELSADELSFQSERLSELTQNLAVTVLLVSVLLAGYVHGLALANAHYYKIYSHAFEVSPVQPDANNPTAAGTQPKVIDGSLMFRAIDQGILKFDEDLKTISFINTEGTIQTRAALNTPGIIEIGNRFACPFENMAPTIRGLIKFLYFLDDVPMVGQFFEIKRCMTLSQFREFQLKKRGVNKIR